MEVSATDSINCLGTRIAGGRNGFTMIAMRLEQVPVFILCGGLGTRLREQTEFRPKPMVAVGNHPILWHIMRSYSTHGFRRFVLCTGYRSEVIKSYFLNYSSMNSDFTVKLRTNDVVVHSVDHEDDWEVTVVYTGEETMTGARIARAAAKYLGESEHFAVTYGDGLTNADLLQEWNFHLSHDSLGTVLGVNPPSRFGEFKLDGARVTDFEEKPEFREKWINGGYFFFRRAFVNYLSSDTSCVLEKEPLLRLAQDQKLQVFRHDGFWQCMDTQRDCDYLNDLWKRNDAPWKVESTVRSGA
jgi:glucose-1-phosphate cytidylyltransferase